MAAFEDDRPWWAGPIFNQLRNAHDVWFYKSGNNGGYFTLIWEGVAKHSKNTHVHVFYGELGEGFALKVQGRQIEKGWARDWEDIDYWSDYFKNQINEHWNYGGGARRGRSQTSKRKRVKRRSSKRKRVKRKSSKRKRVKRRSSKRMI